MRFTLVLAMLLLASFQNSFAQPIPAKAPSTLLYVTGTSVGNGADTTADTLQTFNIPAGQLANVGDAVHIEVGGAYASSTDTKNVVVKFGSSTLSTITTNTAGVTRWSANLWVVKTASNAQSWIVLGANQGSSVGNGVNAGTTTQTDTNAITVLVTGQNATNSVANSVSCQILTVQYFSAS